MRVFSVMLCLCPEFYESGVLGYVACLRSHCSEIRGIYACVCACVCVCVLEEKREGKSNPVTAQFWATMSSVP